jgi:alcohol dehydrogenase class IV
MDPPLDAPAPFSFSYRPGTVAFGDGAVADLADVLGSAGVDRGLVVTGETVGASDPVMQPVREGLGERLAGVAAVTTPEKRLATAGTIVERAREADADGFVAAGGGSSLDLAKVASVLAANEPSLHDQAATLAETGTLDVPDGTSRRSSPSRPPWRGPTARRPPA